MKVATVLLIMSLLGVSTLAAQNRVVIDKTKLRNLARDAGVLSMIETKESVVEPPAVSIDATPQDVQSGDFEIGDLNVRVSCGDSAWTVPVGPIPALGNVAVKRKLPRHPGCDSYGIELAESYF